MGGKIEDYTGRKFNMLTVLYQVGKTSYGSRLWMCQCDCGNKIVCSTHTLTSNHLFNCGCEPRVYIRTCIVCGKEFDTTSPIKQVCSLTCKRKRDYRTTIGEYQCKWCNAAVKKRGDFCSEWCEECYTNAHKKNKKIKRLKLTAEQELHYGENHKYSATVQVPEGLISYKERVKNVK